MKPCGISHTAFCMVYFGRYARKMIQGEIMKRKKIKNGSGSFPSVRLFTAGFILGILIPNILWKIEWRQKTLASVYLLSTFAGKSVEGMEYFLYVLWIRGGIFLLAALCGLSVFGVPLAVFGIFFQGLELGLLLTMSILQFGLAGGAVGAGLLLPQYVLYLPALFWLCAAVYAQSMELWKNHGLLPERIARYFLNVFGAGLVYFGGIILESFVNSWAFQVFTKNLQF